MNKNEKQKQWQEMGYHEHKVVDCDHPEHEKPAEIPIHGKIAGAFDHFCPKCGALNFIRVAK
jgi:hypothetical protein